MPRSYDSIIIGSGAGGGTLARQLAPIGKREALNWDAKAVFINSQYISPGNLVRPQRKGFPATDPLFCRRRYEDVRRGALSISTPTVSPTARVTSSWWLGCKGLGFGEVEAADELALILSVLLAFSQSARFAIHRRHPAKQHLSWARSGILILIRRPMFISAGITSLACCKRVQS
jgi:hypothetical protein